MTNKEQSRVGFIELLFRECDRANSALLFVSHDEQLGRHFDKQISLQELNVDGIGIEGLN